MISEQTILLRRIRIATWVVVIGLLLSGATAIPIAPEVDWLVKISGAKELVERPGSTNTPGWAAWLTQVQAALQRTARAYPFLFYGTDWLAFGHFVIAIVFIGALRDPVRNEWLFTFGQIACVLVIPYALLFGAIRGIPLWWRLIDSSFGVLGFVPMCCCRIWLMQLSQVGSRSIDSTSP
jgi:hypothetical protein